VAEGQLRRTILTGNSLSALSLAILRHDTASALAMIEALHEEGHDLSALIDGRRTALMQAIVFEEYDVAARLVDLKVDVTVAGAYGSDALDYICDRNIPGLHDRIITLFDLQTGQENGARS
jgi:hypothetical protein